MLLPKQFPSKLHHQGHALSKRFSILVWNVHKENELSHFKERLKLLIQEYPPDFLLFQEVKHPKARAHLLDGYSYALASNIETRMNLYGVTTAAKVAFEHIDTAISSKREVVGLATHKSLLITGHRQIDGGRLYLVNLHAVNFVTLRSFTLELSKIEETLQAYQGALVIGGDFNNWSSRRIKALDAFQERLGLQKATLSAPHHVKAVFSKPIDHIFYRGIRLLKAEAIDTGKVSDHNPIYATFEYLTEQTPETA